VQERWPDHPGTLEGFAEAVTPEQAREALADFIRERLPSFGDHQDALWEGEPFLYHSRLSAALNLKLLDPRDCIEAAEDAWRAGEAPLNAVEGFVRQILGWREYVRGIYWHFMPDYASRNALECDDVDVPGFYWTGETRMACVADALRNVLEHGYAHHIQRLMVLGLFAQLLGVHPYRFHEWHMALYLDAVDWVSLPNTLGMSQYGDGGLVGTKPYCASGRYIQRMGNHCGGCRYDPGTAVGEEACPFTTLYWDFLARHRERLDGNRRMKFQLANLDRKDPDELSRIQERARTLQGRIREGEDV
jgi:deoxyribodipyrimidine photolyase-related protein